MYEYVHPDSSLSSQLYCSKARDMAPRLAYLTDGRGSMALEAQRAYRVRFWVLPTMMATEWYVATEHETGQLGQSARLEGGDIFGLEVKI